MAITMRRGEELEEPVPLEEWRKENVPEEKMVYRNGAFSQFNFFDHLTQAVCPPGADYEVYKTLQPKVVSVHTSKSINLPVVEFRTQQGIVFTIRDNFHDYKVSVDSPIDIDVNFYDLLGSSGKEAIFAGYFEGFPDDRIYGPYSESKRQFSVELSNSEKVFMFLWLITRATSS